MKKFLLLGLSGFLILMFFVFSGVNLSSIKAASIASKSMPSTKSPVPSKVSTTYPPSPSAFSWSDVDIFENYASWPVSVSKKPNDRWPEILFQLRSPANEVWAPGGTNPQTTSVPTHSYTMSDVNGDGLTDILFIYVKYTGPANGYWSPIKMAVWLNKGSNSYDLPYKCYVDWSNGFWYGDCAAL